MSGEVCEHCGAHYWLRSEHGRFCGACGLSPFNPPGLRDMLREAMERGHDPIGVQFEGVAIIILATFAACALLAGMVALAVSI